MSLFFNVKAVMDKETSEEGWWRFIAIVQQISKTPEGLNELFEFFMTHEERMDLAGRVALIQALLRENKTQREIAEELGVSIAKITRGSNGLKQTNEHFKQWLTKQLV